MFLCAALSKIFFTFILQTATDSTVDSVPCYFINTTLFHFSLSYMKASLNDSVVVQMPKNINRR